MKYARFILCFIVVFCLCFWPVAVSASSLDDSSLPSETVDIPSSSNNSVTENSNDSASGNSSVAAPIAYSLSSSGLDGLASFTVDSNLGQITLFLPDGFTTSSLRVSDGRIYNVTNATIYLFCPDHPDFNFSASRFSPVYYRDTSGSYNSIELTGVSVVSRSFVLDDFAPYIIIFGIVFICFGMIWRRSRD